MGITLQSYGNLLRNVTENGYTSRIIYMRL